MQQALYIVSTPIGNLQDITFRAVNTLKEVDFIVCEDTRVTKHLLNKFDITKEMVSLNARNENSKINYILGRIQSGECCALVSDAGTPAISDPGVRLVSAAIKENIQIVPVPGVTALITALSLSGLPTDSFVFEGFLPQKKGRQKLLKVLSKESRTIILYESAYRIKKLIDELCEYMPNRYVVICRELTKIYEEAWRGLPMEIYNNLESKTIKGEFVIIIAPKNWVQT